MGLDVGKKECEQQRRRPACTSMQSDRRFCHSLIVKHLILLRAKFHFLLVSVAKETGLSLAFS